MPRTKKSEPPLSWKLALQMLLQLRLVVAGICMWKLEGRTVTIRFAWITIPYRRIEMDNHGKTA